MSDQAMVNDCEHDWQSRIRGGVPLAVRACYQCRAVDWDDITQQLAEHDDRRRAAGWLDPDEAAKLRAQVEAAKDHNDATCSANRLVEQYEAELAAVQPVIDAARELAVLRVAIGATLAAAAEGTEESEPYGRALAEFNSLVAAVDGRADSPPEGPKQ